MLETLLSTLLAVAIPDAMLVLGLSALGWGPQVYGVMAEALYNMLAYASGAFTVLWLCLMFIVDAGSRHALLHIPLLAIFVAATFATALLKGMSFPWAVQLLCPCLTILNLGYLRAYVFKSSRGYTANSFFLSCAASFSVCGLAVLIAWCVWVARGNLWNEANERRYAQTNQAVYVYFSRQLDNLLDYDLHCGSGSNLSQFTEREKATIKGRCSDAEEIYFMQWAGPAALAVLNCLMAALSALACVFQEKSRPKSGESDEQTEEDRARDIASLKYLMQSAFLVLTMVLVCMYCATYLVGATVSVAQGILALAMMMGACFLGYLLTEVDQKLLQELSEQSVNPLVLQIFRSDWVRALAVMFLNVLLPLLFVLDRLRQMFRNLSKHPEASEDIFTPSGRKIADELGGWRWHSILTKVNLLGIAFICLLGGMKLTYVFFSWMNLELAGMRLPFAVVSAAVFAIGWCMFMIPIVPGSAVYLFGGVVLGAQAQVENSEVSFAVGVAICCGVCSAAKLLACCGQYGIGYCAGQSVKVQQFVGVDKVPTRAMEKMIKEPGFKLGKVCILVAGPDFPTSMLCGILKVNIPQMLLGTSPVILVSIIPQCLVGALLVVKGGGTGTLGLVSAVVNSLAAAAQATAVLIFTYQIMKFVEKHEEELAAPRAEHEAVAKLTAEGAAYQAAFDAVTDWWEMSPARQVILILLAILFLGVEVTLAFDFMITEKICLRSFAITSRIGDDYDLGGLNGNALNLVILPLGAIVVGLGVLATIMHWLLGRYHRHLAKLQLTRVVDMPATDTLATDTLTTTASTLAVQPKPTTTSDRSSESVDSVVSNVTVVCAR
eukprot:TRINITY_DN110208_c0_g1_i1.p1 TRINITY_DN110208_c0_g1~~TRINITY_DN110208_c0_g1_i1.p1  ORF type:complete len:834 (+),score=120.42 TRINITY_DN110208_c0_g1_i1:89-2590(+)